MEMNRKRKRQREREREREREGVNPFSKVLLHILLACIPGLSPREKMLGSRLIANYVSRTVYINTEVQYYM